MGTMLCLDADTQQGIGYYKLSEMPKNCEYCPNCIFTKPKTHWRCQIYGELWRCKQECHSLGSDVQAFHAKMFLNIKNNTY
jgi:hypothetical protein